MTKLLTEQELTKEIYTAMQVPYLSQRHDALLALINSQKQAHADMVIGEDEAVQCIDDQPATELDEYAEYRNGLRHNQRLRNTL